MDSSTNLAAVFMSHIFCAEVLCTSNTEKLNCDAGAGCSSSGVCSFYCKSFLSASGRAERCAAFSGSAAADPITLRFAVEGADWFYLSSPGCLCQRFGVYFALPHTGGTSVTGKKSPSCQWCHLPHATLPTVLRERQFLSPGERTSWKRITTSLWGDLWDVPREAHADAVI